MKRILCCMLMLVALAVPAFAQATQIQVQGTATVTAKPDLVIVTGNVSVFGETVARAQEKMNAIVAEVNEKLIELGVQQDDIVTQNYYYYPVYPDAGETPKEHIPEGFQANHTLKIVLRNVEMLDGVMGVMMDSGINEIYDVNYDVADRSSLYQQALAMAIKTAQVKAEKMAEAAGLELDHLEKLTENGGYDRGVTVNAMMESDAGANYAAAGTGIRGGNISVTASVTAEYETK